jgi:hypothetical protein
LSCTAFDVSSSGLSQQESVSVSVWSISYPSAYLRNEVKAYLFSHFLFFAWRETGCPVQPLRPVAFPGVAACNRLVGTSLIFPYSRADPVYVSSVFSPLVYQKGTGYISLNDLKSSLPFSS